MVGAMPTTVAKHAYNVGHYCNLVLTQWVVARLPWLQNTHDVEHYCKLALIQWVVACLPWLQNTHMM